MASNTAKRVVAYRFDRHPLEGFASPAACLLPPGVELLSPGGEVQIVPYATLKALCFVTEFGSADLFAANTTFERRPRLPGLWARFTFLDGDVLDGILPHNLLDWPVQGYVITPPRTSPSKQRVFIPRQALRATEPRAVIGTKSLPARPKKAGDRQIALFD